MRATGVALPASSPPGPLALNHSTPALVGTRIVVDHGRTCGWVIGPVTST